MSRNKGTVEVTLQVFSGRPDPKWLLSEAQVDELKAKLNSLPSADAAEPKVPPGLGYRGVRVTNASKVSLLPERIIAYSGVLAITHKGTTIYRQDVQHAEEWLLHQAQELGYGGIIDEALRYQSR